MDRNSSGTAIRQTTPHRPSSRINYDLLLATKERRLTNACAVVGISPAADENGRLSNSHPSLPLPWSITTYTKHLDTKVVL